MRFRVFLSNPHLIESTLVGHSVYVWTSPEAVSTWSPEMWHFTLEDCPCGICSEVTDAAFWKAQGKWLCVLYQSGKELSQSQKDSCTLVRAPSLKTQAVSFPVFILTFKQNPPPATTPKNNNKKTPHDKTLYKESEDKIIWANVLWEI